MSEPEKKVPQPPSQKKVFTFGGTWTKLFEASLARQMAGIIHFNCGDPKFFLKPETFEAAISPAKFLISAQEEKETLFKRLNSKSRQASELIFRFEWFISHSDCVFVDSSLLDTAIGHHIVCVASQAPKIPCYGVGVDDRTSPLAPAFLKAIVFPQTPDDLVKLALDAKTV